MDVENDQQYRRLALLLTTIVAFLVSSFAAPVLAMVTAIVADAFEPPYVNSWSMVHGTSPLIVGFWWVVTFSSGHAVAPCHRGWGCGLTIGASICGYVLGVVFLHRLFWRATTVAIVAALIAVSHGLVGHVLGCRLDRVSDSRRAK